MTDTAVAVDLYESLDVKRNVSAQVTLNCVVLFDLISELCDLFVGKILGTCIGIDACLCKNVICACLAYTVNVGKSDLNTLLIRNINTCYTSPSNFTSLSLFVRLFAINPVSACAWGSRR